MAKHTTKRWLGMGLLAGALGLGSACSSTEAPPVRLAQVTPGTGGTQTGAPGTTGTQTGAPATPDAPTGAPATPGTSTGSQVAPGTSTGVQDGTTGTGGSGTMMPQPYTGATDAGVGSGAVLPPGTGTTAPGATGTGTGMGTTGTGTGGSGTTLTPDTNTSGTFLPAPSGSVIDGGAGF